MLGFHEVNDAEERIREISPRRKVAAMSGPVGGRRTVGEGDFVYQVDGEWADIPESWEQRDVSGITVDSEDNVYVLCPDELLLRIYDSSGKLRRDITLTESHPESDDAAVQSDVPRRIYPHSVTVAADGTAYWVDMMRNAVHGLSVSDEPFLLLGLPGVASETGTTTDFRSICCSAGPFNGPTKLAIAASGDFYVSDGYRNARVHCFAPDGVLKFSWGEPGPGKGQFTVPHSITLLGEERLVVADRENNRLQFFDLHGGLIEEWDDVVRPTDVAVDAAGNIYVAELALYATLWSFLPEDSPDKPASRVTIFSPEGSILARWGSRDPTDSAALFAPHCIAIDSRGDIYVGEVNMENRWTRPSGLTPTGFGTLHKFVRV